MEIIPSKFTTNRSYPWITHSIKKLSKRKQRLYNQACLSLVITLRTGNCIIKSRRNARENVVKHVESWIDGNNVSKKIWSYIKSKKTDYCGIAPLQQNGTTCTDSKDKATILNNYFASIFVSEDGPMPILADNSYPDISPLLINNEGVTALLLNLKDHKAGGPAITLLKRLAIEISPVLAMIFQTSLHQSVIPIDWKLARVVPIFKKVERHNPGNYRPVSLTCICSKLLEHIIYSHIFSHLKKYDILCEQQHGFRAKRSCETQLLSTINDIAVNLDEGKQTDVILLKL